MRKIEEIYSKKDNHPYTAGLFKCIPDLKTESARLTPIPGNMANPEELPIGCKFSDRCTYKMPQCTEKEPDCYVNGSHHIKCYLYKDKWGQAPGGKQDE